MMDATNLPNIPPEAFRFVSGEEMPADGVLSHRRVGYWQDAFQRFCRNRSSVVAAVIIGALVLYALLVPIFCATAYSQALTDPMYLYYAKLYPKWDTAARLGLGFWDGAKAITLSQANYHYYLAIGRETGTEIFPQLGEAYVSEEGKTGYDARLDTYLANGFLYMTLTEAEYRHLQQWQLESGVQVIYPAVTDRNQSDANIWYETNARGVAQLDSRGEFVDIYRQSGEDGGYASLRLPQDPGKADPNAPDRYRYATITGDAQAVSYQCRIFLYSYFQYRYGQEPGFLFGTNGKGEDILTRLATGARFSLIFALCIAGINLCIGAVYGAIEGYYGGTTDLVMERFSDILSRVPFLVVATLFQLHLAQKVGVVPSLLFAFVLTGWIAMAATVRMQFYRFKGREYVLAARVLGAGDGRIMFRHIFPNALGTIITGSVLVIPGVIFSESMLTYLGIVNLEGAGQTSVGTLLANARGYLSTDPHILLFPALFISLLMICFNLLGNGLRDAFNPALRGVEE